MAYTISTVFAIYFVLWWLVLFLTLPFGVRSQHEDGEGTPGTDPGAPGSVPGAPTPSSCWLRTPNGSVRNSAIHQMTK